MAITQRVRCPAVLEVDVAVAIQIPDIVTLSTIDNDLPD